MIANLLVWWNCDIFYRSRKTLKRAYNMQQSNKNKYSFQWTSLAISQMFINIVKIEICQWNEFLSFICFCLYFSKKRHVDFNFVCVIVTTIVLSTYFKMFSAVVLFKIANIHQKLINTLHIFPMKTTVFFCNNLCFVLIKQKWKKNLNKKCVFCLQTTLNYSALNLQQLNSFYLLGCPWYCCFNVHWRDDGIISTNALEWLRIFARVQLHLSHFSTIYEYCRPPSAYCALFVARIGLLGVYLAAL